MKKIIVNICEAPKLTEEAKSWLQYWYKQNVKFSDLIFYSTHIADCKNWIICKAKDNDMFFSLSLIDSCKSSFYGDTEHFNKKYNVQ